MGWLWWWYDDDFYGVDNHYDNGDYNGDTIYDDDMLMIMVNAELPTVQGNWNYLRPTNHPWKSVIIPDNNPNPRYQIDNSYNWYWIQAQLCWRIEYSVYLYIWYIVIFIVCCFG